MAQAKTLIKDELDRVLNVVIEGRYPARDRAMIMVSFLSGMRVGEIASLKIGDVIENDGRIKNEVRLKPEQTKGKRARTVMIGLKLQKELEDYINTLPNTGANEPLFRAQNGGGHFNHNALVQKFKAIYKMAGVDGASSHSGRRTFITDLANKGVSVRVLQSLAGHRDIGTTQRYIDVNDEMKRQAVELI